MHCTMKRLNLIAALILIASATGCYQEPTGNTATKPERLTNPELSIEGVPATIESGDSFSFTVTSLSEGAITVSVNKPSVAVITETGTLSYEITAMAPTDTKVTIEASQEQNGKFSSGTAKASFKVKGMGGDSLPGPNDEIAGTAVNYTEKEGEVIGPERGIYAGWEVPRDQVSADGVRARVLTGHTVQMVEFNLHEFMSGSISSTFLTKIQNSFDAFREAGAKAIVRFAYIFDYDINSGSSVVTDPEVEQVLKHVEQLKPVLQKNEDVIFVLQAGFVGAWGEWYYTSHFGMNPTSTSDYAPRKQLTDALLDAVPSSRQIELRTPKFKMKMYGKSLADTLTAAKAHDGSAESRLAGHNDCFGASESDQGTFDGNDTRAFWKAETRYTIMGGESCDVSEFSACPVTLKDLEDYHWTYLHDGYHEQVIANWKTDGCYDEIKARLGYRLVLKDVHYEDIKAGEKCKITIRLYNKGYAAPMNPRNAWLVWVGSDGKTQKSLLGSDPRGWHSGYNAVVTTFTPTTAKGTLYLELSDPLLPDNPDYSMPLANEDVFDATTGYNKLFEVK